MLVVVGLFVVLFIMFLMFCYVFDLNVGVNKDFGLFDFFKFGFKVYKVGQKFEVVEVYCYVV